MNRVMRIVFSCALVLSAGFLCTPFAANAESDCEEAGSFDLEEVEKGVRVCDAGHVSVILDLDTVVAVPPLGHFVSRNLVIGESDVVGESDYLVWVDTSGVIGVELAEVTYGSNFAPSGQASLSTAFPDPQPTLTGCNNTDRSLGLSKWRSVFRWWYAPRDEVSTFARNRFGSSIQTWLSGLTRCTSTLFPNALQASFMGNSSRRPSLNADLTCPGTSDGTSIVGWKPISPNQHGAIGATCSWGSFLSPFEILESDVTLSSNDIWYFPEYASSCYQAYDMQKVATHEFGHAIGLEHGGSVSGQVMDSFEGRCYTDRRRLGLGDLYALVEKYPLP